MWRGLESSLGKEKRLRTDCFKSKAYATNIPARKLRISKADYSTHG